MGASEEHLFDIGRWSGRVIDSKFPVVGRSGRLSPLQLLRTFLASGLGSLGVRPLGFGFPTGAVKWDELDTAFIERQRMAEVHNGIVRAGERQVSWNHSSRSYGVPGWRYGIGD